MRKTLIASIQTLVLGVLICSSFVFASFSEAEDYAFYVNKDTGDGGDGSKDAPFKEVEDAVEKAKGEDKIFIYKGEYNGGFKVPSSVGLVGENREGVVIGGSVMAANGSSFNSLTLSGGAFALTLEKNASVAVDNCTVKNATKIGINVPPGNGKLVVNNSNITGNRKGFYIQSGNQLQITGSLVHGNKEEGIDLRDNNDGFIQDNEIYDNTESGIEIVLGKTDMLISGNSIRNNSASGIAAQYYESYGNDGRLVVRNNDIKSNGHFGLRCGLPKGGNPSVAYWGRSVELAGNNFSGNGSGNIEGICRIMTEEEKAEQERIEREKIAKRLQKLENGKTEEEKKAEEELRKQKELEDAISIFQDKSLVLEKEWKILAENIEQKNGQIEMKNKFSYWLFGPKKELVGEIEKDSEREKQKISEMKAVVGQAPTEEVRIGFENKITFLEQATSEKEALLMGRKKDLSFWSRTKDIFRRK